MKVFSVRLEELSVIIFVLVIAAGVMYTVKHQQKAVETMLPVHSRVVILDAGHGGWDPGKNGTSGLDEKEINLQIAQKLEQFLEQGGATVYMTRTTDEALGAKKREDMQERKKIANVSDQAILVSIHQNSFPKAAVNGAQVFYYHKSDEGKRLAEHIQATLIDFADHENTRVAKSNDNYYILKNTQVPAAIVECGFLSNPTEEQKLNQGEYQEKIAWAIYTGIVDYFAEEDGSSQVWNEMEPEIVFE